VQDRLRKFASFWQIRGLVDTFNTNWAKIASFNTDANLPDEKYAMVATVDGTTVRRLPMPNAVSVKLAAEYLFANRFKYPYEWRKTAARRILQEAITYDDRAAKGEKIAGALTGELRFAKDTGDYLERAAGLGMCHPLQAAEKIAQRVLMLKSTAPEYAVKLAEIAVALGAQESTSPAELQKLAAVIDATDRETGLSEHYIHGVELPEEMFFDVLAKEAEEFVDSHITLTTGKIYPVGVLAQIPLDKLASVMGDDFVKAISNADGDVEISKLAEIAPTLPRGDATLFERVVDESMREPLQKGARAGWMAGEPFSKESLTEHFKKAGKKVNTGDFSMLIRAD